MNGELIEYARREIVRNAAVMFVGAPIVSAGVTSIEFDLDLSLGHRWVAQGASPTGVMPVERVRFDFCRNYPAKAPQPSYRPDLGRAFPHVQPWRTADGRPVPCLTEGSADDFVAAHGVGALVDQFVRWLGKAADGSLIDSLQGWEPSRRDGYPDAVLADVDKLHELPDAAPTGRHGYAYLQTHFATLGFGDSQPGSWLGEIRDVVRLDDAGLGATAKKKYVSGNGIALALWATTEGEKPPVFDAYEPDDVETYADLVQKASRLRVDRRLKMYLDLLTSRKPYGGDAAVLPVVVLFLVRRPMRLIGSCSDVEIFAYGLPLSFPGTSSKLDPDTKVTRLAVRERLSERLLRRASGTSECRMRWALVGAGSLGSKVGVHLARQGTVPVAVTDKSVLMPHNVARHGLIPTAHELGVNWRGAKSTNVSEAIKAIARQPVRDLPGEAMDALAILAKDPEPIEVVLNTTASLALRGMAATLPPTSSRWLDSELFDRAALAMLRTEGPQRNPNVEELAGVGYILASQDDGQAAHVFSPTGIERLVLGEGCGSSTMVADDARLSLQAAAIAESVAARLEGLPDTGLIEVWRRDGGGLRYSQACVSSFIRVDAGDGWTLSVAPDVVSAIEVDVAAWPKVETGGVLMGRVSLLTRTIYALCVLPASSDSKRSSSYFELGVDGVDQSVGNWTVRTGGAIYCVGTWHSHLGPATPSNIDRATAGQLGEHSPYPLGLLIKGTDGFQAVYAGYSGSKV